MLKNALLYVIVLKNIHYSGDLLNQFEELDMKLAMMFLEATRSYLGSDTAANKPLAQYHNFLLNPEKIKELETMYSKV